MFNGKIKELDDTYNYQVNHIHIDEVVYDKVITHYLSLVKPWEEKYYLPFHGINYYKYLIQTEQYDKLNNLITKHIQNANLNIYQTHDLLMKLFEE